MMVSLRTLKNRIKSVENTQKITHAMEMVSSSKLNRVRSPLLAARHYFSRFESILYNLLSDRDAPSHPLLNKRVDSKRTALCVITSDAGLCSVYNYAMIRLAEDFINSRGRENIILITAGREGYNYFKKEGFHLSDSYSELYGRYSDATSDKMADNLMELFLDGASGEVYVGYTEFSSNLRQKPKIEKFLNVDYPKRTASDYIIEPDFENAADGLLKEYVYMKLRVMLLSALTSEHASRMIAMRMATDNARDLLETLTLLRNKARQASITKEVLEVAMSAEALKG